ncbi:hypothetical protein B0H10DRAFT_316253 [Mycena sp. CBHHK59/15]|nr:hypothetical protein B0H10DRAFT_316253 [Mycena sp. CBHHK59/15]
MPRWVRVGRSWMPSVVVADNAVTIHAPLYFPVPVVPHLPSHPPLLALFGYLLSFPRPSLVSLTYFVSLVALVLFRWWCGGWWMVWWMVLMLWDPRPPGGGRTQNMREFIHPRPPHSGGAHAFSLRHAQAVARLFGHPPARPSGSYTVLYISALKNSLLPPLMSPSPTTHICTVYQQTDTPIPLMIVSTTIYPPQIHPPRKLITFTTVHLVFSVIFSFRLLCSFHPHPSVLCCWVLSLEHPVVCATNGARLYLCLFSWDPNLKTPLFLRPEFLLVPCAEYVAGGTGGLLWCSSGRKLIVSVAYM